MWLCPGGRAFPGRPNPVLGPPQAHVSRKPATGRWLRVLVWGREQLGTPAVQGALQDVPPLTLNRASWEAAARTAPRLASPAPPRPEAEGGAFFGVTVNH